MRDTYIPVDCPICASNEQIIPRSAKENIVSYLDRYHPNSANRIYLSPYCHEYYDRYDVRSPFELQHGLDDVKLNLDRAYIGNVRLVDFLANIGKYLENRVDIDDGRNDYDQDKLSFNRRKNTDANTTIFRINEKNVDTSNAGYPGPLRYLTCYAQKYLNGKSFITFNERKPGRIARVTLPHTSSAAMINISRLYLPSSKEKWINE